MKKIIIIFGILICTSLHAQNFYTAPAPNTSIAPEEKNDGGDSSRIIGHVYHVNFWGSAAIAGGGGLALLIARLSPWLGKPDITDQEFNIIQSSAYENSINAFDRWSLHLGLPSADYTWTAVGIQIACGVAPFALFFGDRFRKNWDDITLMLLETNAITTCIFQFSPFGPLFQNRYRPIAYYATTEAARDSVRTGDSRNSFFSGHSASATASLFFMAKVYCDYHPEIQGWDRIGIYALASVPPLVMGYFRLIALRHFPSDILTGFLIGGTCGIAIPEIHRIAGKTLSFGLYTSPTSTGVNLAWSIK